MKRFFMFAVVIALLYSCKKDVKYAVRSEKISCDIKLKTTPIKNQDASSLCWVYAMLATIETEHLMQGDSVNLSPDYVARMYLMEQANQRLLSKKRHAVWGNSADGITTRGMSAMAIDLIQTYGLQHFDAYHRREETNYNVIARKLNQMVMAPKAFSLSSVQGEINEMLDKEINLLPKQVFMFGAIYTPQEFARSVCRADEYVALTSFLHHPFGEQFTLEVPDNYFHNTFLNVPLNTMMEQIERTVRSGHPVCWEGDTSENGFLFNEGIARNDDESMVITPKVRQKAFENHQTTDDHCMAIVGMGHDKQGNKYFLCKNSWGKNNRYGGYMYLSHKYVMYKTIAVYLPKID